MNTTQKVVVVTGASGGIGASLARRFLDLGYGVVATARSIAASDIAGDARVAVVSGDIADPHTSDRIFEAALERFGRIDTVVNNAGVFISKPFIDYDDSDFASAIAVNLAGFFHTTRRAATLMLRAGSGHIVNITASIAEQPQASVPAALAALTKGGLNAVTRSLAIEYAGRGLRVNAVSPGVVRTPMHPPQALGFLAGLQPMGRVGETHEIVEAVLYLEGADFVTGEILHVDGGAQAGVSGHAHN